MKDNRKYIFVGTRPFVLNKMFEMNLNLACIAVKNDSPVENELKKNKIKHQTFKSKEELLKIIKKTDFDILVSNGCPYILPISELKTGSNLFINLHPSLLPDLKGNSPVNGSILFNRPQGATCHIMDDGIDTGDIISQVVVCDKPNIPLDVLYQLSFMAEAKAFEKAHANNFKVSAKNNRKKKAIYYTRKDEDLIIDKNSDMKEIETKVKAFAVEGQYARIISNKHTYMVKELNKIQTKLFIDEKHKNNEILHIYKNNIITYENGSIYLWRLDNSDNLIIGHKFYK